MYRIRGHMQNYPWGVAGGLRSWLGPREREAADPMVSEAELWFGAHQNGPSPIVGGVGTTLRDEVDSARVPLLVKLLAAAQPLSIQVHPPLDRAIADFAAQQRDPKLPRLLSDAAAKTEMLIALKPFSALAGLRDLSLAADILTRVGGSAGQAASLLRSGGVESAIASLLTIPAAALDDLGRRVPAAAAAAGLGPGGVAALATVTKTYPDDPGVLVAVLLDHRTLDPGQAVFLPAGVVHAYVAGTGVEVMTASDNVLRLGLTSKVVAVDAGLKAMRCDLRPEFLDPTPTPLAGGGESRVYAPPGSPFAVTVLRAGLVEFAEPDYRLVLAVVGEAAVSVAGSRVRLACGEGAAVLADDGPLLVEGGGATFVATPSHASRPPVDRRAS